MIAIITEKAIIARQIAAALNVDTQTENEGYFQGRGYMLVWAGGELISLSPPEDYGKKRLAKDPLPFIPDAFSLTVRKKETGRRRITDRAAVKQLDAIKKVFDACESIIAATDSGEEGELLFRRIYAYLGCEKPFKRLWINFLTLPSIRHGIKNPKESAWYDNVLSAADCRVKADYLINFNASRAFSLSTGLVKYPVGWALTPTLAIVCRRYHQRRNYISTRFFKHCITLEKDSLFLRLTRPGTTKNKRKAEKIYRRLKTVHEVRITKMETGRRLQPSPLLYNLMDLQRDANTCYGFSAAKTQEIALHLFEEKLISYPLTESRHIPEEVFPTLPKIIRQTTDYCEMTDRLYSTGIDSLNRRSVAGNTDASRHHALLPTGVYPGYQTRDGKVVYHLIVRRTLEAFAPDCQKEVVRVEAACLDIVFESIKSRILAPGWRSIQNRDENREEDEAKEEETFPVFMEGETVCLSGWNLLTHKTLPPARYTEAGLLTAMEETGLGTAGTRASLIETLLSCGYLEHQGASLVSVEKGLVAYNHVKNMRIADPQLAGSWEKTLADVREGRQNADTFMTMIKIYTRQVTDEILSLNRTKR